MFSNIYKNRTVLITGHTGFKGSWLSLWLHRLGAKVIGYALKPPTQPCLFDICNLRKKIISIEDDVRNFNHLKDVIKKYNPEIIFHLAAQSLVRYAYYNPVETFSTNVMGTAYLLEAVRQKKGVRVIINVTSDKCYENKGETQGYRESDPLGGDEPYSSSKGCAELVTNAYLKSYFNPDNYKNHKIAIASVRAGNVIGGGDWANDRLVPDCIRALINNKPVVVHYPDAVRPWQHVLEPLFGYLLLGQHLYKNGATFTGAWNFGPDDDSAKSVKWIIEQVVKMWGGDFSWKMDRNNHIQEALYLKLNSSKAKSKLGWYPRWNLNSALQETVRWYKSYYGGEKDILEITTNQIHNYEKCI